VGNGTQFFPPFIAKPHVVTSFAKTNIVSKFAGNARSATNVSASQKQSAASKTFKTEQQSCVFAFSDDEYSTNSIPSTPPNALRRKLPAHPFCTNNKRVEASHRGGGFVSSFSGISVGVGAGVGTTSTWGCVGANGDGGDLFMVVSVTISGSGVSVGSCVGLSVTTRVGVSLFWSA